jgi:hypothetical protein
MLQDGLDNHTEISKEKKIKNYYKKTNFIVRPRDPIHLIFLFIFFIL